MAIPTRLLARHWRLHQRPFLLWTGLVLITFGTLISGVERLPDGDFSGQFHAFALFQAREMAAGRLPLWSPGSYAGFPFVADPQAAVFYPLRWLTILLSLPWGFTYYALHLETIFHVWLAGLFTYLLAHELLRRTDAALASAVVFGLGGYLLSYPLLQLAILETITWWPLVLLLLRRGVAAGEIRLRPLLAAALTLGLACTAGHPQTFLQMSYVTLAYGLYLGWRRRWSLSALLKGGALAGVVTAGVAAAAWLPVLVYTQRTTRAAVDYNFVSGGLPLQDFLQLLLPGVFSFWSPAAVGTGTLLLLALAWHGRSHLRGSEAGFWTGTAVIAAILSLGDSGILFALLHRLLPGFGLFRSQERWLAFFSFGLALLAGYGLRLWREMPAAQRTAALRKWGLVLLAALGGSAVSLLIAPSLAERSWPPVLLQRVGLLAAFILLLWRGPRNRQAWLLPLLLAGDLYLVTAPGLARVPQPPRHFWPQPAWLDALRDDAAAVGRIDSRLIFWSNVGEIYDLRDIRGISPLKHEKLAQLEKLPLPLRWSLLNVTHTIQKEPEPDVAMTAVAPVTQSIRPGEKVDAMLYRLDEPQPYAWMAYDLLAAPDETAAFQLIASPDFDVRRQAVITGAAVAAARSAVPLSGAPPQVDVRQRRAGVAEVQVTTETAGVLALSEWDVPGWRVWVDGAAAERLTVNYALQGVWLPPGIHTVSWRYRPWHVPAGLTISMLTATVALALLRRPRSLVVMERGSWRLPLPETAVSLRRPTAFSPTVRWRLTLLPLTLAAWGLRVAGVAAQELRGDEGFSYLFATLPLREIVPALLPVGDPHSPLHYWLLHGVMALLGDSEFAMRLPALVFGVLLVPLAAAWGRQVGGRRVGALAALFVALSQSQVWLSQDVRSQYVMAASFSVLATILLVRACEEKRPFPLWAAYAAAAALALHSHYYAVFILPAHAVYIWRRGRRQTAPAWTAASGAAALLLAPWVLATWPQVAATHLAEAMRVDLAHHLWEVGEALVAGPAFGLPAGRWVLLAGFALLGAGWLAVYRRQPAWAWMLAAWLGGTTWVIYLVRFRRSIFNDYYLSVIAPAWWLLAAWGVVALWRRGRALPAALAVALLLGTNVVSNGRYHWQPAQFQRFSGYREAAAQMAAQQQPGDVLLLHTPDPAFDYYLRHLTVPQSRQPTAFDLPEAEIETALAALAEAYDRVWFVPAVNNVLDPTAVVPRWLDYHMLHEMDVALGDLHLQAFRPVHSVDGVLRPLHKPLQEWLVLEGFYVTVNGRAPADGAELLVSPGDTLTVTLVWRARQTIPADLTVFVHLLGADGQIVTQQDNPPLFGTRPTTTWRPGERLIDRYTLHVPPNTPAQVTALMTGMYDPATMRRQSFAQGETVISLLWIFIDGEGG